ncbi:hypothetical protein B0H13DRAFT_523507 [Mycena leptocephala]|nr:hypothetical protein B0H13DRAFT_523507 [Mycena leptocephala]
MLNNPDEVSDNERLITALRLCFSDLNKRQEEQTDRIQRAVEALKQEAPVTDKQTAFWNSYMKLADEHDEEFHRKYSSDLDTALIFAGLFSAVSSAFIIQIEPQLIPVAPESSPPVIIVAVQSMLYISLFVTLLAALLAVLGKQWIMYYEAAGSRGTIEQRGLERQRKLDGLRRWKFDAVLRTFPLLLQLALLLFSSAFSVYLFTINRPVAIIIVALTSLGFASYIFLLVSVMVSPDSPFQTPITLFLARVIALILETLKPWGIKLREFTGRVWSRSRLPAADAETLPSFSSKAAIWPKWNLSWAESMLFAPAFDRRRSNYFPPQSPEVPAVLWVLETSTDPAIITAAAEIAADLQWPLDLDLEG